MRMPDAVEEQAHNAFRTIIAALEEAGTSLAHVVRANYVITDAAYAEALFPIFGAYFGEIRPASMLIVAGLLKPEMKFEIEVTARLRG